MATSGAFPLSDGNYLYATSMNILKANQIYTGSQANISAGSSTAGEVGSHVFDLFTNNYTSTGSYLHWTIFSDITAYYDVANNTRDVTLILKSAPSGTTPSFTEDYSKVYRGWQNAVPYKPNTFEYFVPITEEMRRSGVIPALFISGLSKGGANAQFENIMTKVGII